MSTSTQATPVPGLPWASPAAPARPKIAVTFKITGVGQDSETGSQEYDQIELVVQPTRGSRSFFPKFMFRPEMLSAGFDPNVYTSGKYADFAAPGKPGKTKGDSYIWVYRINVNAGDVKRRKDGTLQYSVTSLIAAAGGDINGAQQLNAKFAAKAAEVAAAGRAPSALGTVDLTREEVAAILKEHVASYTRNIEQIAILKQSTDQSGGLSDRYEVAEFGGVFTKESHEAMKARAAKSVDKNPNDVSKQIVLHYSA